MKERTIVWIIEDMPESIEAVLPWFNNIFVLSTAESSDTPNWAPRLQIITDAAATLAYAYECIQSLTSDACPDIVICDVRLDGVAQGEHKQVCELDHNGDEYKRMSALIEVLHKEVADLYGAVETEAARRSKEAEQGMMGNNPNYRTDFLAHGGWYASIWIKRKAQSLGCPPPEIIFFSGSDTATVHMLPVVVGEGQIIVDKGEESLELLKQKMFDAIATQFSEAVSLARDPLINKIFSQIHAFTMQIINRKYSNKGERRTIVSELGKMLAEPLPTLGRSFASYRFDLMNRIGLDATGSNIVGKHDGLEALASALENELAAPGQRLVFALTHPPWQGILHADIQTRAWYGAPLIASAVSAGVIDDPSAWEQFWNSIATEAANCLSPLIEEAYPQSNANLIETEIANAIIQRASAGVSGRNGFCQAFGYTHTPFRAKLLDVICKADNKKPHHIFEYKDGITEDSLKEFYSYIISSKCLHWLRGATTQDPTEFAKDELVSLISSLISGDDGTEADIQYEFSWSCPPGTADNIGEMLVVILSSRSVRDLNPGYGGFGKRLASPWYSISLHKRNDNHVWHVKNRGGWAKELRDEDEGTVIPDGFESRWELRLWGELRQGDNHA